MRNDSFAVAGQVVANSLSGSHAGAESGCIDRRISCVEKARLREQTALWSKGSFIVYATGGVPQYGFACLRPCWQSCARLRTRHHVSTAANGTQVLVVQYGANRNDNTQLLSVASPRDQLPWNATEIDTTVDAMKRADTDKDNQGSTWDGIVAAPPVTLNQRDESANVEGGLSSPRANANANASSET